VQARSVAGCEQLAGAHPKATVAVVSHADVIRTVLSHYLGAPLDLYQRLDVAPVALSIVDIPPTGFPRVPMVNSALVIGGS
jgi:probable phosphoglycerate mutase